jgi:hypothetical protein
MHFAAIAASESAIGELQIPPRGYSHEAPDVLK